MGLNVILLTFIGISCGITMLRTLRSPWRNEERGWIIAPVIVLTVCLVAYVINDEIAGLVGAVPWLLLIVIPSYGIQRVRQLTYKGKFKDAAKLARLLVPLHPMDSWQHYPKMFEALHLSREGQTQLATEILQDFEKLNSPLAAWATVETYRMTLRYDELKLWFERHPHILNYPNYPPIYIRALGESGDLNAMVAAYVRYKEMLTKTGNLFGTAVTILGLTGRKEALLKHLDWELKRYDSSVQNLWLGTVELATGNIENGREALEAAAQSPDKVVSGMAQRRLAEGVQIANEVLTAESKIVLTELEKDLEQILRYSAPPTTRPFRPYATYLLIAVNAIIFVVEMVNGGSESIETLYKMGALVPRLMPITGESWRLLTAMFLHYGVVHLLVNMYGLYILGRFAEYSLGRVRYVALYFISGIGSMLLLVWLSSIGLLQEQLLVGASGAIMGLFGGLGATMLWGWLIERASVARQRLTAIIVIVLLQVFLDVFVIPQSSLEGHLGGALIGFFAASILTFRRPKPA